jgi:hypothetical protein
MAAKFLTLDPSDPKIRTQARELANQLVRDADEDNQVISAVRTMLDDIAQGECIVVLRADEDATLAQAARMLEVTHSFVERLLANGVLPFSQQPNSTQRYVKVSDVLALAAERKRRQYGHAVIRDAFADAGLLDNV